MTLSVLIPNDITDAVVYSSTVAETDYTAWNSGTTYALGDKCISTTTHRIYESAVAGNLNKDPTNTANQIADAAGVIYWVDKAPTNKWAMFDTVVSTQTVTTSPLVVVLKPGFCNAIFLGGVEANTIAILVKDAPGGTTIADTGTVTLEGSAPADYYEYFFEPFRPRNNYLLSGLDQYYAAEVTITLTNSTSVKCGIVSLGDLRPLGRTLQGAKAKPKTYSYINTDSFGTTTIRRRKATTDMSLTAKLPIEEANAVLETIQSVLDVPCVWIADECQYLSGLMIFGLGSAELGYPDSTYTELSLNVAGLI